MRRSETETCAMTGKTSSDRETMQKIHVISESLLHLPLWMIFRHMHINLINVRSTYAS